MNQITPVKRTLLAEIETLPEHRLPEVLDFVQFLQHQESRATKIANGGLDDPLAQFIGGVEHGKLAQDIDEGVYTP